jgi:RHS repeat-associated protein
MTEGALLNDRYQLEEKLGSGGMADVYLARDVILERRVAIKVLRKDYSNNEEFQKQFLVEARSAANLSHPNIVTVHDFGIADGLGITTWIYNDINQVTAITDPFGKTVSYAYDSVGNQSSITYPNTQTVSYSYDSANRLTQVNNSQSTVSSYQYDNANRLVQISRPNGVDTGYGYDDAGRLLSIDHVNGIELLSSFEYLYDNVGNRIQAIENIQQPEVVLPTATPSQTPTATQTSTPTLTNTPTQTPTETLTPSPTNTSTPTMTQTSSETPTQTASPTFTQTNTPISGLIFSDSFESGNFTAWDYAETDGGDMSVSTQSPAVGSYGMQALIDDNHEMVLYDETPNNEKHYSARFYFDPNSMQSPNDGFYIFSASSDTDWVACVLLEQQGDHYSLSLCGKNDANSWLQTEQVLIADEWQAVEIEWKAASATGANDGYIKLYIGDELAASLNNIDNDTQFVTDIDLGVIDTPTSTSGTMYFDEFESRTGSHIGLHPSAISVNPPPARPDALFADDFESNNLSAWNPTLTKIDSGDLFTSSASAYQSNYGLQALIDDTVVLKAVDSSPANETQYRARFYFDPNSLAMNNNSTHFILDGYNTFYNAIPFRLELLYESGTYKLRPRVMKDDWGYTNGSKYSISNDWHVIEIDWKQSTSAGANNGYLSLWIDGTLVGTIANVDNDAIHNHLDEIRLGAVAGIDSTTSGSMLFDNFESRRFSYIGPVSAPATSTPTPTQTETPTITPTPTNTETPTPTFTPTETPLAYLPDSIFSNVSLNLPALPKLQADYSPYLQTTTTTTINYEYDPLYRLTSANYSTGDLYQYTYDAVGNRLTETTQSAVNSYQYDSANRLTSVNGVNYTFDDNGNLLSDGVNTYTYDSANRLISVSNQSSVNSYQYNGLGDRYQQTVNGNTTTYILDLNTGLTQVLDDGTNTYTYGLGRISQTNTETEYFLTDALASVRQLTDTAGEITLSKTYNPYGENVYSGGDAQTNYGFTGEYTDVTGNVYLRARYYNPNDGRFMSRDTWSGDVNNPLSLNRWMYVEGNPVNYVDPSGFVKEDESHIAASIVNLLEFYGITLRPDWGYSARYLDNHLYVLGLGDYVICGGEWREGDWSIKELLNTVVGVQTLALKMGGPTRFMNELGTPVVIYQAPISFIAVANGSSSIALNSNYDFDNKQNIQMQWTIVHELAHIWDANNNYNLSKNLEKQTNGKTTFELNDRGKWKEIYNPGSFPVPACYNDSFNRREDFAESVAAYLYPDWAISRASENAINLPDPECAYEYWGISDFRDTKRGEYIKSLLK